MIFTPVGRDAQIAAALLDEAGIPSLTAPDIASLIGSLGDDIAFAVMTEEALRFADLRDLSGWIASQPSWSDLPFIVLTQRGGGPERNPAAARLSDILGNVSFLERPFHATTFISMARSAARGRRRQYQARLHITALDHSERRLQTALQAGELGAWELDLSSQTLTVSDTFRQILGSRPADEFHYQNLIDAIHPADAGRVREAFDTSLATGEDLAFEFRILWPDGSLHWVEMRAQIYREGHADQAQRLVGVCAEVTETPAQRRDANARSTRCSRTGWRSAPPELEVAHADTMAEIAQRQRAEEQLRQAQKDGGHRPAHWRRGP